MTELFELSITDGPSDVNFLSNAYRVRDGGFDIGMPKARRVLTEIRPGVFLPTQYDYEYREGKITFEVLGVTRQDALKNLHKIERLSMKLAMRKRVGQGERVQMFYAWEGNSSITYFEVYAIDFKFPDDVFSVGKLHVKTDVDGEQRFYIPDCEVTLFLSPFGYGHSLTDDAPIIPVSSPETPVKTTAGVWVQHPTDGATYSNYVKIAGADLAGSGLMPTRIAAYAQSSTRLWNAVYIGHRVTKIGTPPSVNDFDLRREAEDGIINYGSVQAGTASGGEYVSGSTVVVSSTPAIEFQIPTSKSLYGLRYAFMLTQSPLASGVQVALGYKGWGINHKLTWVKPNLSGLPSPVTIPLGSIMLPPPGPDYHKIPNLALTDLKYGLFIYGAFTCDYLYFLPIDDGFRIWNYRGEITGALFDHTSDATSYDDDWKGVQYHASGQWNQFSNWKASFTGLLNPIRLVPGAENRLYFFFAGSGNSGTRNIKAKIRVYGVPTYQTLAL